MRDGSRDSRPLHATSQEKSGLSTRPPSHQFERKARIKTPSCDDVVVTPETLFCKGKGSLITGSPPPKSDSNVKDFYVARGSQSNDRKDNNDDTPNRKYGSPSETSEQKVQITVNSEELRKKSMTIDVGMMESH